MMVLVAMPGIEPGSPAYEADELPLLYIASPLVTYGKNTLPRHPVRDVLFGDEPPRLVGVTGQVTLGT